MERKQDWRARPKVWIIVTQDGDIGEGPWENKQDAQDFLNHEVGILAGLLEVHEDSVKDIRRATKLAYEIQDEPEKFRGHL